MPSTRLNLATISLMFFAGVAAHAQQYSFQYYGVDQGLTNLAVRALFQDRQGFLWLSTETGVFRYDGSRFRSFGPADGIPVANAAVFGEAPDGTLLVGGTFGLYRRVADRFEQIPMPGAQVVNWGAGIQRDSDGHTWIATEAGLMAMTAASPSGTYRLRIQPPPAHTGGPTAYGVMADQGMVWWGCGEELCAISHGATQVFGTTSGLPHSAWKGITRAANGDIWVQSRSGLVCVMRHGEARFVPGDLPESRFGPRGLLTTDRWGSIIAPEGDGLVMQEAGRWKRIGHPAGLHGPVYSVLQDREGTLWLGLGGHGLAKWLGYRQWEHFTSDTGLGGEIAYQVIAAGDGSFWAATDGGLYRGRASSGAWTWRKEPRLGDIPVHSIHRDGRGRLWLGTESRGAARLDTATGSLEWYDKRRGLTADSPYILLPDSRNRIWAGTLTGLFVASQQNLQFAPVKEVPAIMCLALLEASDGTVWAGTARGLFELSKGHWQRISKADGLSHDEILSLAQDADGGIWVGYQFGPEIDLVRRRGGQLRISSVGSRSGSPGVTYFLGFDAAKRLWAGTNRGVDIWDGEGWQHYDHNDGLVWDDCDLNGFAAMPDGSVWVGTSGGLARYTPREEVRWKDPPVTIFTKLTLGGNNASQNISVSYSANALDARFSSLSFAGPDKILFRYRLFPMFNDWRETPQHELQFPGLAADSYRLEVEARDRWGRWSAQPASYAFEIRPPWWRSWWSISMLLTGFMGILALIVRWRGRAARERERRLVHLVDERTAELKNTNRTLRDTTQKLQEANQYLVRLSTIDGLTCIANRRMFDQTLETEWAEAQRSGTPLSVVLADIDHFKRLNDSAGHQAGDDCLKRIASELARTLKRDTDLVARFGGEEFALILPATDGPHAFLLCESLRIAIENLQITHPNSPTSPWVTVSLGIATAIDRNFEAPATLLGAADSALYTAKQRGRNRVANFQVPHTDTTDGIVGDLSRLTSSQSEYSKAESTYTI